VFSGLWWVFSLIIIVDFIWLDHEALLFIKVCEDFVSPHIKKARTLCFIGIQHLFSSEQWFLDLVSVFVSTSFLLSRRSSVCKSCLQFVTPLFNKAKTLCFIEIQQSFGSEQWSLDFFVNTWFCLSWRSSVCKSCSDLITPRFEKAKALYFIEMQEVFRSDQCFLDFG